MLLPQILRVMYRMLCVKSRPRQSSEVEGDSIADTIVDAAADPMPKLINAVINLIAKMLKTKREISPRVNIFCYFLPWFRREVCVLHFIHQTAEHLCFQCC